MVKNIAPHKAKHTPGESVYERYLRTEELLSLQKPEDELTHHDELQFQIVHCRGTMYHPPYACYNASFRFST